MNELFNYKAFNDLTIKNVLTRHSREGGFSPLSFGEGLGVRLPSRE
jgi:hypothetical protein